MSGNNKNKIKFYGERISKIFDNLDPIQQRIQTLINYSVKVSKIIPDSVSISDLSNTFLESGELLS